MDKWLIHPVPGVGVVLWIWIIWMGFCTPLYNLELLFGGEQDVSMRLDGKMLSVFLFQAAINPAFGVERVEIVDVKLRRCKLSVDPAARRCL
jgi:hypothetical protein